MSNLTKNLGSHIFQIGSIGERFLIVKVHRFFNCVQELVVLHELATPDADVSNAMLTEDLLEPLLKVLRHSVRGQS